MPIEFNIPQCEHIRINGTRCGSPALKSKPVCYYHNRMSRPRVGYLLPPLEDANSIQFGIWEVLRAVLARHIESKDAGLLLYGLQIASQNLKQTDVQPYWKNVVRVDPTDLPLDAAEQKKSIQSTSTASPQDLGKSDSDLRDAREKADSRQPTA